MLGMGKRSNLLQNEIANKIANVLDVSTDHIYKNKWLDIEVIYREAGWSVYYDKPAYYETYKANLTFRKF